MSTGSAPSSHEPLALVLFAHVYYLDIWREMAEIIAGRLPVPFRLIITTPHDPDEPERPDTPFLLEQTVHRMENRGRDILPFLKAMEAETRPFEIGLKLHTKRSPHRPDGEAWRQAIVGSLLPSRDGVEEILATLRRNPHVGLLAPQGLLLPLQDRLGENLRTMRHLATAAGGEFTRADGKAGHFVAGSMFWFRREALAGLGASQLSAEFEAETGQLDATAAHAVERLFVWRAERWRLIALPVDALAEAENVHTVEDARRLVGSRTISPHAWQPPRELLLILRYMPFLGWIFRRMPRQVRKAIRDVVSRIALVAQS